MATQDISQLVVEVKSQGIQTAANQLDKLATASDKAEAAVRKLGTAVVGATGGLNGGVVNATALASAMVSLTIVLERMSQTQTRTTVTTRANNEAMAEAHALARGLSGSLGALWVTYGNLAGMGVGIALGASLKGVIGVGKDVEQTLEGIRVLGGATSDEMVRMTAAVGELGTGVSGPLEVAEALKTLTLAGLNTTQALQGVGAALNLAIGGEVSIEKSAETLVQVGSALGYTAASFDHVSDVIVKTAAASMSSVDSISGAFKSAAAVGTTYGATLQDIALGLAAVANLGIQGTAAGTALKNLYKDLSASTDKVTNTLKDMKMSIASFRDAEGFMLPLVEVIQKLDAGMNTLSPKARNLAMVKLFGQQGLREGAALISLLHQAADDTERYGTKVDATHNKLVELQNTIAESAATAKLAAIAMGQTTENQFKSVKNTLQTTFSEVFKEIQPQVGAIARALKEAFGSEGFKTGLKTVIGLITDFTKVLIDNAAILRDIGIGVVAGKLLLMADGFRTAAGAALTFQAALGPIAIMIGALTFAWKMYKQAKDRALSNKDAEGNLTDYVAEVQKETEKQVSLYNLRVKYGSDAAAQRLQEAKERREASQKAVDDAKAGLQNLQNVRDEYVGKLKAGERKKVEAILALDEEGQKAALEKRKGFWTLGQQGLFDNISNAVVASREYAKSQKEVALQTDRAKTATEALIHVTKMNDKWSDEQAKKNRIVSPGDGELTGKGGSKADAYNAAIAEYTNDIKEANQALENAREEANAKFRSGEMGKLQLIDQVADKEVETYNRIAKDAREAAEIAAKHVGKDGKADKTADVSRFNAEATRAEKEAEQADKMRNQNKTAALREMHAQQISLQVKSLEEQGKYVDAANLKWTTDGKVAWEQAKADAKQYGDMFPWLTELVNQYAANRDSALDSATLKEDSLAFNTALIEVQSTLKGFKSDTFGSSVSGLMDKATAATEKYKVALENAKKKRDKLEKDAAGGKPEAVKAYEEANKELLAIGDKQKTMWVEVGQTITSSLKDAFGNAGESLGKLNEAMIAYKNTENATAEDRMGQYADMAQAASGFFDKQSKGYKVLNGIAQVFHVAQMARTLAQTAASVVAGAANFFAQSGWGGFAGVAAMGAVLAGLGWAMSGASSHGADPKLDAEYVQKHQGTGTVLGDADAKSKSISESIDTLKNNSDAMLPVNQAMLHSLKNIEASMNGLAILAIHNGVTDGSNFNVATGVLGSGAGTMGKMAGTAMGAGVGYMAGAGLSAFTSMGAIGGPLGMVAGAIVGLIVTKLWGKTTQEVTDAGLMFGGKVSDIKAGNGVDQYAAVKTTKSSWFGLSKSSSSQVLTSDAGQEMNDQFGKIFIGLQETLQSAAGTLGTTSEAVGKAIDGVVLQTTKISLKDLKGDELAQAINNVISEAMDTVAKAAYPQMQAFQQVGEGYAQTVIRVASGVEVANDALEKFGISAVNYALVQNKQGDVAFEIAKQSILAKEGLNGVSDMLKNMTGSVDELTTAYKALIDIRKQMNLVGLNGNGLNVNTVKGAGGVSQLQSALGTYKDKYFTDQEKSAIMLKSVTEDFAKLGVALPSSKKALRDYITAIGVSTPETAKLTGELLALSGAYSDLVDAANKANTASMDALKSTISSLKSFSEAVKSFRSSLLLGDLSTLTPSQKYAEAQSQYESTLAKAKGGDETAQGSLTSVAQAFLEASRVVNASSDEYGNTFTKVQRDLEALAVLTDGQITDAQKQLDQLEAQTDGIADLNATAGSILDTLKGQAPTASLVPVSPISVTTSNDNSDVVAELKALKEQMAASDAANQKQIADLTAALYDATDRAADKTVEGTADNFRSKDYYYKSMEINDR